MWGKMKESDFCNVKESGFRNVGESFSAMPPEPCPAGDPPAPIPPIAPQAPWGHPANKACENPGDSPGAAMGPQRRFAPRMRRTRRGQAQADFPQSNRLEWPRRRAWPTPNGRFPTLCGARVAHRLEWPRERAAMAFPSAPAAAGRAIRPLFPFRTRGPAICCRPKPSSFPRSRP